MEFEICIVHVDACPARFASLEKSERYIDPISRNEVWGQAQSRCGQYQPVHAEKKNKPSTICNNGDENAGTVGASAARKAEGQQTAQTHPTLTNSGAGDSRGL